MRRLPRKPDTLQFERRIHVFDCTMRRICKDDRDVVVQAGAPTTLTLLPKRRTAARIALTSSGCLLRCSCNVTQQPLNSSIRKSCIRAGQQLHCILYLHSCKFCDQLKPRLHVEPLCFYCYGRLCNLPTARWRTIHCSSDETRQTWKHNLHTLQAAMSSLRFGSYHDCSYIPADAGCKGQLSMSSYM